MSYWQNYCYVDAHYEHPVSKRRLPWERIPVDDVARRIVAKAKSSNCFATVQRFKDAASLRELKRDEAKSKGKRAGNGADYDALRKAADAREADELPEQQSHYHGLFFDFDCDYEKEGIDRTAAIARSQADALKLARWFLDVFELNPAHVQTWFSGSKGFHLMVRPEPFGIRPHMHLTYIVRHIACELAAELDLKTMDQSVYTVGRMWRIANTVHPRTGRYKIELAVSELAKLSADEIITKAGGPRLDSGDEAKWPSSHCWDEIEYKNIVPVELATQWWNDRYQHYDAFRDLKKLKPRKPIQVPMGAEADSWPACVKDIMENGPKDGGPNRNRVVLPLAGFMHDAGLDQEEARKLIADWTGSFYPDPRELSQRQANGRSVVDSAYRGGTFFACRFIRSLNGTGEKGRVVCVGEAECPWIQNPDDQEPAAIPLIHLSEASKGCYINTQIRTAIHVAAKAARSYELPAKGSFHCTPDSEAKICNACPGLDAGGALDFELHADDREVLNMINVNDNMRKGALKRKCGIPQKCYRNELTVDGSSNVEELQIIPMVDYAHAYHMELDEDEPSRRHLGHVVEVGYFMGHGIETNKKYVADATVLGHPKDQRVCFLFDKAEPAQNDIDQFIITDELKYKLRVFQRRPDQSVEQKLIDIHRDLTANVHQIGGRFELSIAIDLCYHSVIGFMFAGKFVHKGWFELLVLGDTSSGKTTMVDRMRQHYGLGELIAGEDSKRTGLVYASLQLQGQWILRWGKIPQNDRRLLIIDEFAGISQEEIGKMTQLRSEGKARGGGVNADHETWARTRLIFLSNPRGNRGTLGGGFNYGIEAVKEIFGEDQDLRRVDLAVTAEKKEVASEFILKRWDRIDLPHRFTADLCRNMVLWAWSREPHHVKWVDDAEDGVIKWAGILGDTYECDIPLAERADLRFKIARIAAATAARLFSTDEDAKFVLVRSEHVDFAAKFMDRLYRKGSMGYFEYARNYKNNNLLTDEKKHLIRRTLDGFENSHHLIAQLRDVGLVTKPVLADLVTLEPDELKRLWKFLIGNQLLRKMTKGYRKSNAFTEFLRDMTGAPEYKGALSDDFETGGNFEVAVADLTDPFEDIDQEESKGTQDSAPYEDTTDEVPF